MIPQNASAVKQDNTPGATDAAKLTRPLKPVEKKPLDPRLFPFLKHLPAPGTEPPRPAGRIETEPAALEFPVKPVQVAAAATAPRMKPDYLPRPKSKATSTDRVKRPDFRILDRLAGLAAWAGKTYTRASQEKICELLWRFDGIQTAPRTLRRHLNALDQDDYIEKVRRTKPDGAGGRTFDTNLYKLRDKALRIIRRAGDTLRALLAAKKKALEASRERYAKIRTAFLSGAPPGTSPQTHRPQMADYTTPTPRGYKLRE